MKRLGGLIRLKQEFEERYIILHKYTFPRVLLRIHASHIHNYSIFLRDGTLFSFYEYHGEDYDADMEAIALDPVTQDWWKLTDPMQEPFSSRKEGEWWAATEEMLHFGEKKLPSSAALRFAYTADALLPADLGDVPQTMSRLPLQNVTIFSKDEHAYLYLEYHGQNQESDRSDWERAANDFLRHLCPAAADPAWRSMTEVFHTD